ncbi:MAG: hypothetical protein JNM41_05975 [Flavipsychrobacter sp.]|nr:hypothetical protein [Flavipsychrobacter sp.]
MKQVKMFAVALLLATSFGNLASAQEKKEEKMEMKEHKCTAACNEGKHMYAHGEKGHECTKACKKMMKKQKM